MDGRCAEARLITLDTSALVALLDQRERDHRRVRAALVADGGPFLIPALIMAEAAYVIEQRIGPGALDALLDDIETSAYELDCGQADIPRLRELVARYADLPLGLADAAVVACAERNGGRILSVDRDFMVIAKEGKISVLPS